MHYQAVIRGKFLARPNRFIAHVEVEGEQVVCHVKNTGRCRELLVPGCVVYLEAAHSPSRKTAYDLIAVEKGGKLINMDAQAPNRVFAEWAQQYEPEAVAIRPEYQIGQSRLDFCLELPAGRHFVEVKGVTLEEGGHTRFPDAPTERGVKHLHELTHLAGEGYRTTAFFVIQMADVLDLSPNDATHPAFGAALRRAAEAGVHIAAYSCRVTPDSIQIDRPVTVLL
ncbi:MAG: DNA/RNA nuclease SfsA [Ruminococcaceae bacterium]|nr:DNA/RNA nuclease SfsA [Oscillospiraceae bacterium]